MTTDLHARITAAVVEKRAKAMKLPMWIAAFILAACDHADDVLARHRSTNACWHEGHGDPCIEVRALADMWLGKGWDQ